MYQDIHNVFYFSGRCPKSEEKGKTMLGNCIEEVRRTMPLVHNITNYVTVNDGKRIACMWRKPDYVG